MNPNQMADIIDVVIIDVIYLVYNPNRDPKQPLIESDNSCLVGLSELHYHSEEKRYEKQTMDRQAYKHYKWYNAVLQQELYAAPYGYKLQVVHWNIESGQEKAFTLDGHQFNVISMIIGPSTEHWFGANTNVTNRYCMHGHNPRPNSAMNLCVTAKCDLFIDNGLTNGTKNTSNDKDYYLDQSAELCTYDNSDKSDDNCTDMLMLKLTLKQLVCPKRAKKHHFKFISSMITIIEE